MKSEFGFFFLFEFNRVINEGENLPIILVFGHPTQSQKLLETITKNFVHIPTKRGKNFVDWAIQKAILSWALDFYWNNIGVYEPS